MSEIELKHVFSDSHIISFQIIKSGEIIGEVQIYPAYKEIKISVGRSEAIAEDGVIREDMSYIDDRDRDIIDYVVKELTRRFFKKS